MRRKMRPLDDGWLARIASAVGTEGGSELFVLRSPDADLADAGVAEGDIVVLRRTRSVAPGALAAVRLGGDRRLHLRRVRRRGMRMLLYGDRLAHCQVVPSSATVIEGEVVAILRRVEVTGQAGRLGPHALPGVRRARSGPSRVSRAT